MSKILQQAIGYIVGVVLIIGVLHIAGYRVITPSGKQLFASKPSGGTSQGRAGWRRAAMEEGTEPGTAPGSLGRPAPGSQGRRNPEGAVRTAGTKSGDSQGANAARQPGFGPSGGILLPSKIGDIAISVLVGGKPTASFVGKDLLDHVEDTVVATADGPRKGWAIEKTLKYLGIERYKEALLLGPNGQKTSVSLKQIQDPETIPLFTYDEQGRLMVVSGPKVRGTNKGNITLEAVKETVAGRTDLLNLSAIEKIELKG
jgi:hypothetical protein